MIVTVDEVKTHLRIQYDEEDAYLTRTTVLRDTAPTSI